MGNGASDSIINTFANYIGFDDPIAIVDEDERLWILKDIIEELKIQILDKNIKNVFLILKIIHLTSLIR